ncbi:hypothetical protein Esi_0373_0014 [Ectocarpus siliculosus]|uniref:Uncharacterized protein n=1 Tax=Ectocarpus siliculosus TaxID=2880 RepID=D7FZI0_ECTSI|nr:hypothetical protein Esi_0373_0014 [Ectocarpus siliculosus]|eukprot:CBJ32787.1 hypothetical protein Esi_0373_0014 [Ectocarpus siliculosus]
MWHACPYPPSNSSFVFLFQLARQSSVAYLARSLGRASFVDPSVVATAVQSLLDWAGQYLDQHVDEHVDASTAAPVQARGTPSSKGFETPVATRVRVRPRSWHGNHPRRSANGGDGGGMMQAPMSGVSSRSGGGGSGGVGVRSSRKSRLPDHTLCYSVCQAMFYVMCF